MRIQTGKVRYDQYNIDSSLHLPNNQTIERLPNKNTKSVKIGNTNEHEN